MLNVPSPGSDEWLIHMREQRRQEDREDVLIEKQHAHERNLKELDIQALRTEASLTASLKILLSVLKLPFFLAAIVPITIFVITNKPVPEKLWDILKI